MFNITQKFGMIFENRMYVVVTPLREDRGAMFQVPLRVVQLADFVVDITSESILKCRFPDVEDNPDAGSITSQLFFCIGEVSVAELLATEPRFEKPKTFAAQENNPFVLGED